MKKNIVDWKTITSFVIDSFVGYGIPREDAEICADVLLESDKRGIESHGVNKLRQTSKSLKKLLQPLLSTDTMVWVR